MPIWPIFRTNLRQRPIRPNIIECGKGSAFSVNPYHTRTYLGQTGTSPDAAYMSILLALKGYALDNPYRYTIDTLAWA